jgi:hypothetical protein
MSISPQEQSTARALSFTTKAVAVVALYWLGWIPGFIANILFYLEAKRTERAAGKRLPGTGCLAILLGLNVVLLVIALALGALLLLSIRVNGRPLIG